MTAPEMGFEIQGKTYPFVRHDDWKLCELKAVRDVTGYSYLELLGGTAGAAEINAGFATVAFWRGHPDADEHQIVQLMSQLKPSDIKWQGPADLTEGDARPPDESGNEPSENIEPLSEPTPETSSPEPSGDSSSPSTDSGSGLPTPSES